MIKKQGLALAATSAMVLMVIGCSPDDEASTTTDGGAGGLVNGSGGSDVDAGGDVGSGGDVVGIGGDVLGIGGDVLGIGGDVVGSGGTGMGGAAVGSGGTGTGGDVVGIGGDVIGSGGDVLGSGGTGTGGVVVGSGGSGTGGDLVGSGGNGIGGDPGSGGTGTGGDPGSGGSGTGGSPGSGGAGTGGTTPVDPNAAAAIDACMLQLPWGAPDLSPAERAPIVTAIINTCVEFAPPGAEWQTWCQMFLVAAINAESSYDALAGSVGAGNDPTVGLLQIRFTSTVIDFAGNGPVDALARIGCDFGTVTSSDSYATKSDMMLDVTCNIAIGAWYYLIFGSGNGGDDAVWVNDYCRGAGVAGNLHIGMACHLMGAEAAHSSLEGADYYYNQIKDWFDPCVSYSGTHPFELTIQPDTNKYCG